MGGGSEGLIAAVKSTNYLFSLLLNTLSFTSAFSVHCVHVFKRGKKTNPYHANLLKCCLREKSNFFLLLGCLMFTFLIGYFCGRPRVKF